MSTAILDPNKGDILEIHSLSERWDGTFVEYVTTHNATGKFVVIVLDENLQKTKVSPSKCKIPDELEYNDEDLTPAPSLEDLPPWHGTILELQNVAREYNGKLVEFWKIEEYTGNYLVNLLDNNEGYYNTPHTVMRVKPEWCCRPDIKPNELRIKLLAIVQKWQVGHTQNPALRSQMPSRCFSLLKIDPYCIPAWQLASRQSEIRSLVSWRRTCENPCAYGDQDDLLNQLDLDFLAVLADTSRHKTFLRVSQRIRSRASDLSKTEYAQHKYLLACCLMHAAERHLGPAGRLVRELNTYLRAARYLFKALKIRANTDEPLEAGRLFKECTGMEKESVAMVFDILERFDEVRDLLDEQENQGVENYSDDAKVLWKNMHFVANGLLQACRRKDGTICFLDVENDVVDLETRIAYAVDILEPEP